MSVYVFQKCDTMQANWNFEMTTGNYWKPGVIFSTIKVESCRVFLENVTFFIQKRFDQSGGFVRVFEKVVTQKPPGFQYLPVDVLLKKFFCVHMWIIYLSFKMFCI